MTFSPARFRAFSMRGADTLELSADLRESGITVALVAMYTIRVHPLASERDRADFSESFCLPRQWERSAAALRVAAKELNPPSTQPVMVVPSLHDDAASPDR